MLDYNRLDCVVKLECENSVLIHFVLTLLTRIKTAGLIFLKAILGKTVPANVRW